MSLTIKWSLIIFPVFHALRRSTASKINVWAVTPSVSLDTAEIQTHLRLRFKQWVLYTVHGTRKYRIWQNQL